MLKFLVQYHNIKFFLGKEARKRELKKNKKQRQMVRAAVLKGKDPSQIIMEMEKMDQMGKEFNFFKNFHIVFSCKKI